MSGLIKVLPWLGTFLCGLAAGVVGTAVSNGSWETTLNPLDFANLLVTVFLAVTVPIVLTKVSESKRVVDSAIAEKLSRFNASVEDIEGVLDEARTATTIDLARKNRVVGRFRELNILMQRIDEQVDRSGRKDVDRARAAVRRALHEYKKAATGDSFPLTSLDDDGGRLPHQRRAHLNMMRALDHFLVELLQ